MANSLEAHSPLLDHKVIEFAASLPEELKMRGTETKSLLKKVAARLVPPLGRWRRFEPKRAQLMRQALEKIVAKPGLSKDVFEQVSKSLA